MNSPMRQAYPTNQLALTGAIEQMAQIESTGTKQSIEDSQARYAAMVQSRFDANQKQIALMNKLGNQNQKAIKLKKLTSDMVYPKSKWSK